MNQRFVLAVLFVSISIASAEEPKKDGLSQNPQWQRLLRGGDAKKAAELEKKRNDATANDDYETAILASKELYALRCRLQCEDHYQAIDEKWLSNELAKVSALPAAGRAEWRDALRGSNQARELEQRGKYREALPATQTMLHVCQKVLGEKHPNTATSYYNMAANLNAQGKYAEAEPLCKKALDIWQESLGEEHPHTGASCNNLAGILNSQGNYAEAEPLYKKALAIRQKALGEEHPLTAASCSNLAGNLHAQGKFAEAETLYKKALAIKQKALGEEHPDTALSCNNLAFNLDARGKYAEAEPLHKKALEINQKALGQEHPTTAICCNNLAANLDNQGKFAEAEPLHKKALAIWQKALGEKHPNTATSCNNLAFNLNAQGKFAEAEVLYKKALDNRQKSLGEEHPHTAASYNNLANNLNAQGKYAEAEPLCRKALTISRKTLGEEHPATARSCNNMAFNLNAQGKYAEAESLYRKALAIGQKALGEEHPDTATSCNNVAACLNAQGKYAEAEPLCKKGLVIRQKALGEEHPDTATSYNDVAVNLNAQGKYAEAEPLFEKALAIWQKTLGDEHPHTAASYNGVASNLNVQGKYAEAGPLFEKALAIWQKSHGDEHPSTAQGYNNVAANLKAQGKYAEAEPLYKKTLAINQKTLGEEHPRTALSYNNVASNLDFQGKYAEAEPLYRKALVIRQKALGEEHPDTALARTNLAFNLCAQGRFDESRKALDECRFSFEASRLAGAARGTDRPSLSGGGNPYPLMSATQARFKSPREAFAALEISLARGLLDELASRCGVKLLDEDEKKRHLLVAQLAALQPRIAFLVSRPKRNETEQKELDSLLAERTRLSKRLADLAVDSSKRHVASLEEIQKSLKLDEAWIAWVDVIDQAGGVDEHWGCVLRSSGDPNFERLPGHGEKGKFTKEDRALPVKFRVVFHQRKPVPQAEIEALAKQLHAQRLVPLEKHLQGVSRLYVVAVNEMAGIPVDALTNSTVSYVPSGTFLARLKVRPQPQTSAVLALGDPIYDVEKARNPAPAALPPGGLLVQQTVPGGNADKNGIRPDDVLLSYAGVELKTVDGLLKLIQEHTTDRSVPITIWRETETKIATRDVPPGKLGVVLAKEPAPKAIAKRREFDKLMVSLNRGGEWNELPGTRLELKTLTELFGRNATVLADENASEARIDALRQDGSLGKFRYLHFASHGEANNVLAYDSALILSQNDPKKQEIAPTAEPWINGRLTAREVLEYWKLDAELVTLSACQTALGRQGGGDGLLGFAQAFLLAGSRSVCLSLWEVDDRATALLMDRFYRNLLGKREGLSKPMRKADALAEAKKWLRNLTQVEVTQRLADLTEGVVRGKDQKALPIEAPQVDPKTDPKQFKPFNHPRFWAAFILIGDPS